MSDLETPTRTEILERIHTERQRLEDFLNALTAEQFTIPGVEPGWTAKDLLAHIAVWEERMVAWITAAQNGEIPDLPMGDAAVDALNAATWERDKDISLDEAWRRFHAAHPAAVRIAEQTPDDVLFDPAHYPWRAGRPMWFMVAANTYWHYEEHMVGLETWRAALE
jgi:hypothetical protein